MVADYGGGGVTDLFSIYRSLRNAEAMAALVADLRALKQALDDGLLSEEEFQEQRTAVLARASSPPPPPDEGSLHGVLGKMTSALEAVAQAAAGMRIYHRWDVGWFEGNVLRQVQMSSTLANNGKWAVKYADSRAEKYHALLPEDYGPDRH